MRPCALRPPLPCSGASSDFSGVDRVISAKSATLEPRRPGVVGLYLRIGISCHTLQLTGPPKASMRSPSASFTIARFVSLRLPQPVRVRLRLPSRLIVFTVSTRTSKICSMAILIWVLLASGWTRNVYQLFCSSAYDFSDTTGATITSRGSAIVLIASRLPSARGNAQELVQGLLGEDHVVADQHVVRVQLVGREQVHLGRVAQRHPVHV